MPARTAGTEPEAAQASDTTFDRDVYLLAPIKLPRDHQYAVSASDGQLLLLVKRGQGGRGAIAFVVSVVAGFIIFGFISSVGDSLGNVAVKWATLVLGGVLGIAAAIAAYPALLAPRLASFGRRERPGEKVLEVKQAERSPTFEVSCGVTGERGRLLGTIRRNYLRTLFRSEWSLYGAAGHLVARAREESLPRAIAGRALGWIVPTLRSNYALQSPQGMPLGYLDRRQLVQGRVMLDFRQGGHHGIDQQLGVALGVLIDLDER